MKRHLLIAFFLTLTMSSWGQGKVIDVFGQQVDPPVWGTPEADNIVPRRHVHDYHTTRFKVRGIGTRSPQYLTHNGTPHILTILVNYKDSAITVNNPKEAFNQFFNHTGSLQDFGNGNYRNYGSVSKYFNDVSNGKFKPVFDVYGPVTLPQNMTYYGGVNENSGFDENPAALVSDALALVKDSINNVSIFDGNNDGYIDCVYIIYAGPGQNFGGGGNTVWAKTHYTSGTFKGLNIGWYSMAGEITPKLVSNSNKQWMITGVGTTCHELSHAMGLPDNYPTTSSAYLDNQEMEYWDLMDGGEYVYNGYCPAPYTAWEKNLFGWDMNIQELTSDNTYSLSRTSGEARSALKITNPQEENEYFLLENIQQIGWGSKMPAKGLLVYHVNEKNVSAIHIDTHLNNIPGQPGMAVVPADGALLSSYIQANRANYTASLKGDLFAGPNAIRELNDAQGLPNFFWYNGTNPVIAPGSSLRKVNKALKNITENNGTISFEFVNDFATGIHSIKNPSARTNDVYSIDGRYVGQSLHHLPSGIYICNGKKIVIK